MARHAAPLVLVLAMSAMWLAKAAKCPGGCPASPGPCFTSSRCMGGVCSAHTMKPDGTYCGPRPRPKGNPCVEEAHCDKGQCVPATAKAYGTVCSKAGAKVERYCIDGQCTAACRDSPKVPSDPAVGPLGFAFCGQYTPVGGTCTISCCYSGFGGGGPPGPSLEFPVACLPGGNWATTQMGFCPRPGPGEYPPPGPGGCGGY